MNRLILNTANKELTILLEKNGKLFCETLNSSAHHNETMLPAVDMLLKKNKLTINKINELGIVIGPGSFTGIRVGVATIKAFRDALKIKAKGINNLDLLFNLATSQNKGTEVVAIKGSADSYFVARKVFDKVYKYTRNLTLKELAMLTKKPIGVYENSGINNEFVVKFDADIMLNTFLNCTDESLMPVYYQLSQAEREKLNKGALKIAKASAKDVDAISLIETNSISVNTLTQQDLNSMQKDKNYKIYVAKFNDEIVGFIVLQLTDEVNIISIAVKSEFRNIGVGGKLIKKAESCAKLNKLSTLSLEVSKNNITAYLLYEKCGFKLRRTRKNYYADKSDCLEMSKSI